MSHSTKRRFDEMVFDQMSWIPFNWALIQFIISLNKQDSKRGLNIQKDTLILAINIHNTFCPKQVNTLLSINLEDSIFYFSIILWSFRYFGGLSGNSSLSGKSRHPSEHSSKLGCFRHVRNSNINDDHTRFAECRVN